MGSGTVSLCRVSLGSLRRLFILWFAHATTLLFYAGYSNSIEGLSGGFVFGAGGSGILTPRFGQSPTQSGSNTPSQAHALSELTQQTINTAFDYPSKEGILIKGDV